MLYFISVRLGLGLPGLESELPIVQHYRPGSFEGSTRTSSLWSTKPPGCFKSWMSGSTTRFPSFGGYLQSDPTIESAADRPFAACSGTITLRECRCGKLVYPV